MNASLKKRKVATVNPGEILDGGERARRLGDLIASPVLPWSDVALYLDLPTSTLDMLRAKGCGPKSFLLGRRIYVRQADLREWIDAMAIAEAA